MLYSDYLHHLSYGGVLFNVEYNKPTAVLVYLSDTTAAPESKPSPSYTILRKVKEKH